MTDIDLRSLRGLVATCVGMGGIDETRGRIDRERRADDQHLVRRGHMLARLVHVLRFLAEDVGKRLDDVLDTILRVLSRPGLSNRLHE